jgi:hypothetical protein
MLFFFHKKGNKFAKLQLGNLLLMSADRWRGKGGGWLEAVLGIRDILVQIRIDRDPRIRTSDEWIRIRLRFNLLIRLLSSVT